MHCAKSPLAAHSGGGCVERGYTGRVSQRIDYDVIAEAYDRQPYREKKPDPELAEFLAARAGPVRALDLGCGTGNQAIANLAFERVQSVGTDLSAGMLRQAARKSPQVAWVRADGAALPFRPESFDFVTHQFSFHHVRDKPALLREVHQVLRPGGRFVLTNISPEGMPSWSIYRFFPEARALDARDFLSDAEHERLFAEAGFRRVVRSTERRSFTTPLAALLSQVKDRAMNSELCAISDEAYAAGLRRIEAALAADAGTAVLDEVCLLTVRGDR